MKSKNVGILFLEWRCLYGVQYQRPCRASRRKQAGTIQTQLLSENNETVPEQKKKSGIFAKMFGRGKVADE